MIGFIGNVLAHFLALVIARVFFTIVILFVFLLVVTKIFAAEPSDFLYVTDLEIDNTASSNATQERLIPVPVNLLNYVGSNLIRADGTDRVFSFATGNATTSGFTQDMTLNGANVWVWATSTTATLETQKMYHGGLDADDGFPLVGGNNDGEGVAAGGHSPLRATSTAAIEIADLLNVRIDMSAEIPCGTMVYKVGNNIINPTGYGLWSIGQLSSATQSAGGGAAGNSSIYLEITALDFDLWICTVGGIQVFTDWTRSTARSVEIIEVGGSRICLSDKPIPLAYPELLTMSSGNVIALMLNSPCLIKRNVPVRIVVNGLDIGDSVAVIDATSTDGFIKFDTSGVAVGGAEPWRSGVGNNMHITWVRDSLVAGGISRTGTSTQTRITAMVDDDWDTPGPTVTWDGERTTWQIDYNDPDFDIQKNGIVVDTIPEAGGITTSSFDLEVGRGWYRGTIYNFEIDAGASTVMDVDFDADDISQSRVGNSSNAFQWLGDIQNEGSATTTDLEYVLTFDDTNINTSVSGFMNNPTPTPTSGGVSTSTIILGNPSLGVFFTPVPTPAGGFIMGPLKDASDRSTLPTETFWMIGQMFLMALVLGVIHKRFPNRPVLAAFSVVGMAIVSLAVGADFRMWIVAIYAMWVFGSTSLLVLWAR